ncbi:dimethyladenosine transferase 2, mitochondrial isoform X2 [Trichechus manatus latirostris]|uniref:rRNA adenine N(6)-methyltransferase n=1 Tax=Trichechus manatus latirostris TaxID=127582 RepID=A0A2Y9QTG5_TRIMA|nr:dimethyladenosine transferase 2, mitochondrial isoform X2 [Trichechus manatus latirostris]
MWVTVAGLPARLTLSVLTGAGRFSILGSGVATRKDLPEVLRRGFSDSRPQPLPCPDIRESSSCVSKCRLDYKRYVISRRLAETLAQILQGKRKTPQLVLECNPGPGILTQALLETGARVIALESDKTFIPHLEMLFQNLGIRAVPWSAGIPLKVIGIFPIKSEKKALWKLIYDLYSCTSVYRYGRVELNMFISEKEYQKLKARPKNPNLYQALSVLWQVACDIKLLHMEPWSSFDLHTQNGQLEKTKRRELSELIQQNLCFIRMTPRRNLFTENLTPINYDVFFHMLKQCFGKRNAKLVDHLHSLSPVDAKDILTLIRKHENVKITNICPEDFKLLFETIECSKDYNCKWLCDDIMEDRIM